MTTVQTTASTLARELLANQLSPPTLDSKPAQRMPSNRAQSIYYPLPRTGATVSRNSPSNA